MLNTKNRFPANLRLTDAIPFKSYDEYHCFPKHKWVLRLQAVSSDAVIPNYLSFTILLLAKTSCTTVFYPQTSHLCPLCVSTSAKAICAGVHISAKAICAHTSSLSQGQSLTLQPPSSFVKCHIFQQRFSDIQTHLLSADHHLDPLFSHLCLRKGYESEQQMKTS